MYHVELAFGSDPERLDARTANRETLLRFCQCGIVRLAGSFHDDSGALLVINVPDKPSLESLIEADPFFRHPA
jgi:hypothetical protein